MSNLTSPFDSPTSNYGIYQISSNLVHKQGHYGNIFNFWYIWKKVWGRVINPLWWLKAPSPATKKWIFEFCTKFGFRNHLQTFWPRRLVKSELSLGLIFFSSPNPPDVLDFINCSLFYAWIDVSTSNYIKCLFKCFIPFTKLFTAVSRNGILTKTHLHF